MTTVLIVEDEEHIRMNTAEALEYEGFATLEAENGLIGVQMAQEYLPDLIICDIMMPQLDGFGVLFQLRSEPTTATIPFIFLTARADKWAMRQGMQLGADDYLTKPFTPDELLLAVRARLEKQALWIREREQKISELRNNLSMSLPHELRTPLTSIQGYSELIMLDGATLDRSQIMSMAATINRAGERLSRLIENYLLYVQIELLRIDSERVATFRAQTLENSGEIITQAARQTATEAEREGDLVVAVENAQVQISPNDLQRIVKELVDNALKFSSKGTPVEVRTEIVEGEYHIQIRDRGRGMTPDQIRNVGAYMQFERRFYEQQGSGLGLTIAKRLAELYGGELSIQSTYGEQTIVQVTLFLGST